MINKIIKSIRSILPHSLQEWVIAIMAATMFAAMFIYMDRGYLGPCIDGPKKEWAKRTNQ